MISKKKGFTLIELLVVIAIIGILSSVVLASLNSARNKGSDAAVKSNLNGTRAQAELSYDNNSNSYANVCTDANIVQAMNAAKTAGGAASINTTLATAGSATAVTCHASSTAWAIEAPLKTTGFACVDSNGNSTTTAATTLAASDASCG
jgi:prepilin-type N-terminal cleavage/methylation domain-containing protein